MQDFQFISLAPTRLLGHLNKPQIAIASARSGAYGILELNQIEESSVQLIIESLRFCQSSVPEGKFGVLCSLERAEQLLSSLDENGLNNLLVIISANENLCQKSLSSTISKGRACNSLVAVEVTNLNDAFKAEKCRADVIIAKGEESSGLIGSTTSFILTQLLVKNLKLPVWVRGGIGQHSVAAISAAGAQGAVLDSQLYLARDSFIPERIKLLISQMDGSESTILKGPGDSHFRLYESKMSNFDLSAIEICENWSLAVEKKVLEYNDENVNVLPLGQDAALAKHLSEKGGTIAGIIDLLKKSIETYPQLAAKNNQLKKGSPIALAHNTEFPIVQGAMTRVSDNAKFAHAVSTNGALPFLALTLMRAPDVEKLLSETADLVDSKSWGVGLLGFLPQQLLEEQLAVVRKFKPPFALIAGGRPDQAASLENSGIKTYLHVPSPLILKSFLEMGTKRFIFEGNECGGHIGPRSSFLLWEQMIEILLESLPPKADNSDYHILFAGGLHDSTSAKMAATMAAPLSDRGVKIGFLLGTAYLFTEEAVTSKAIVKQFQERALSCSKTVLLESGPGHAIRCIESPYKDEFENKKTQLEKEEKNNTAIKEDLELMHLGRLRIASKGLDRNGSKLASVSTGEQWSRGMYMIGQLSVMKEKIITMKELHEDISENGSNLLELDGSSKVEQPIEPDVHNEPVAIIGMACSLPQANDVETFWKLVLNKIDAIEEVPESHWNWKDFYNKDRFAEDKSISKWGGFIKDMVFDPGIYGIPPNSINSIEPMQLIMLEVVRNALEDAGYTKREFAKSKTSMLLANSGHGPGLAKFGMRVMLEDELKPFIQDSTKRKIKDDLPSWTEDTFAGHIANVTAGRVSNRFNFSGINFAIDAACASSLAALYIGINELRTKSSDMVIVGATDTHNNPIDFVNFSKTHALSEAGRCKTFDSKADGIVLGEGISAVIVKRLSDAERDGDKIYAVVKGIGGSSDGRALSLTAPHPAGQTLALERAYQDAAISPSTVELVEAHGTGTVAGDKAEVKALSDIFLKSGSQINNCAIGSVKTNIGHTKCNAGLASLIKIAKSLHHKVLPPTINVEKPSPACNFESNPFYINTDSRPWIHNNESYPRRAAVSAFGFGGTNFHTILEEYTPVIEAENNFATDTWPVELFTWRAKNFEGLVADLKKASGQVRQILKQNKSAFKTEAVSNEQRQLASLAHQLYEKTRTKETHGHNLAIVATSLDELENKLERALGLLNPENESIKDPTGIYYSGEKKSKKIAFLFPGQGSQSINMLKDLALYFPEIRQQFEMGDKLTGKFKNNKQISELVYPVPSIDSEIEKQQATELNSTEVAQPAIGLANLAVLKVLNSLDLKPDVVAGHSYGEYVALHAAQVFSEEQLIKLSVKRGAIFEQTDSEGTMLAVHGDYENVTKLIDDLDGVTIANKNSNYQIILSGRKNHLLEAQKAFQQAGTSTKFIPVSKAFHSPYMVNARDKIKELIDNIDTNRQAIPVYSNTTSSLYPDRCQKNLGKILAEHTVKPVLFSDQIEEMYKDGVTTFIEVGPGSVLTSLVKSIIPDNAITAVSCERPGRDGLSQFIFMLAELWSNGTKMNLSRLFDARVTLNSDSLTPIDNGKTKLLYKINSTHIKKLDTKNETAIDRKQRATDTGKPEMKNIIHDRKNGNNNGTGELKNMILNSTAKEENGSLNNALKTAAKKNSNMPAPSKPLSDGSTEQLLIEYQKSMVEMTNKVIDAQKEVMLAYLGAQRGNSTFDLSQLGKVIPSPIEEHQAVEIQTPEKQNPEETTEEPEQLLKADPVESEETEKPLNIEALVENLYEVVSDRTGYPLEMLDPNLDLEADLGIDSIKRVEIFNNFRKSLPESLKFDIENDIEELAELKTLDSISNWIRNLESKDTAPTKAAVSDKEIGKEDKLEYQSLVNEVVSEVSNQAPDSKISTNEKELTGTRRELISYSKGLQFKAKKAKSPNRILIIEDTEGISAKLSSLLRALEVHVDQIRPEIPLDSTNRSSKTIKGSIHQYFNNVKAESAPDMVIHLSGIKGEKESGQYSLLSIAKELKSIHTKIEDYTPSLLVCSRKEEQDPELESFANQCALTGMSNTISLEFDFIKTSSLNFTRSNSTEQIAEKITQYINVSEPIKEGFLRDNAFYSPTITPAPLYKSKDTENNSTSLDKNSLVLVTGGARGITAEITLALAQTYNCNFILLGHTRYSDKEDISTAKLTDQREIKAALMEKFKSTGNPVNIKEIEAKFKQIIKEREIRRNLERIREHANSVKYYSLDVSNQSSFKEFIDSLYELNGKIDGVIHGAGVIEDSFLQNKTIDSFDKVFDTKVNGALALANNLRLDSTKFFYLFSSVVGRTGNPGQIDYVAANEALNKLAAVLNEKSSCSVKSFLWGPWKGGMAPDELESIFEKLGWGMIRIDDGCSAFLDELKFGPKEEAEVIIVGNPVKQRHIETPNFVSSVGPAIRNAEIISRQPFELKLPVSTDTHYYLDDHKLDGIPVFPMAMAAELMLEAGSLAYGGRLVKSLRDFYIPSGVVFENNTKIFEITLNTANQDFAEASIKTSGKKSKLHHKGIIDFRDVEVEKEKITTKIGNTIPLKLNRSNFNNENKAGFISPDKLYKEWLFHGPLLQGIKSVFNINEAGITGEICGQNPSNCLSDPGPNYWICDPTLFDSAMQMANVWVRNFVDITCLPTGFKAMHFFKKCPEDKAFVQMLTTSNFQSSELSCDLAIYDNDGELTILIESLEAIGSKAFNRFTTPQAALK